MGAWGGGIYDEAHGDLWVWGGGHSNYAGNEVYRINVFADTPAWAMLIPPTGAVGNTGTLNDGNEGSGVYFDGRPRSTHTYGNLALDSAGNLWAAPNDGLYASGAQNSRAFRFNRSSLDWDQNFATTWTPTDMFGGSVYVPTRNEIVMIPTSLSQYARFNPDTHAVTKSTKYANGGNSLELQAVYDPVRNAVLIFGNTAIKYLDMATPDAADATALTLSSAVPTENRRMGWAYDSANDRFAAWDPGTNTFVTLTAPSSNWKTNTWTFGTLTPASTAVVPGSKASAGTWGRFFYSAALRGFGLVNNTTSALYFYALDAGIPPRFARPTSDLVVGAWTPSTGADLFAMLDEETASDTDTISTSSVSTCQLGLSAVTDPATSTGQVVTVRAKSDFGNTLVVTLKQGGTTIATRTFASLGASWADYQITLTGAECDAITDYAALSVTLEAQT